MARRTSGSRLRCSMATNPASRTATTANDPMVRADAHPACWAETTVDVFVAATICMRMQ